MRTTINALVAAEHRADLHRAAQGRVELASVVRQHRARVELRLADTGDAGVLERLAALDDARALEGPALLVLVDGDGVAALSLDDRRVVANPFVPTSEVVEHLRLRAEQLDGPPARGRRRRRPRLRIA